MRSRMGLMILGLGLVLGCGSEATRRPPSPSIPTPTPSLTPAADPRARLARAVERVRSDDDAVARALLAGLPGTDPLLADYHLNYLALIDQRSGDPAAAAAHDDRLAREHPQSVWIPHVVARRALRARDANPGEAATLVERALAHSDADPESRALALLVRGDLRAGAAPREAYRTYHEVRRLGGWPAVRARARTAALEGRHPSLLTDVELQLAEAALRAAEGERDLAAERLESLVETAPDGQRIRVLLQLARTLKLAERYDDAVAVLERAVALDPSPNGRPRLQLAYRLWSQDRDAEAQTMFEALLLEAPRHPARVSMQYALGRIAEERGDLEEALRRYRQVAASGDRRLARESRWRLGWAPYRADDLAAAAAAFHAVERRDATDRTPAIYWQARILERQGDAGTAATRYETVLTHSPRGYYGGLAEVRLGRPPTHVPPTSGVPPPAAALTDGNRHWARRTALLDAGLEPFAAREAAAWARGLPASAQRDPSMLDVWAAVGAHARARKLAHQLARSGAISSATRLRYDYPKAHWRALTRIAEEQSIEPFLLLSVMRQESLFDAAAISPVGARGLMQLMPNTARRVSGAPVDLRALADPATNIGLGARYLRQLLDRYDGRLPHAIAAYNAGEHAVDKWIAREGDVEDDEFVESITYRETRTYTKAVLTNLRRYRQIYPSG